MSLLIIIYLIGLPVIIMVDSKKRLGRYSWGWALLSLLGLLGGTPQVIKSLKDLVGTDKQLLIVTAVGAAAGLYAGGFALYRAMTSKKSITKNSAPSVDEVKNDAASSTHKEDQAPRTPEEMADNLYSLALQHKAQDHLGEAKTLFNRLIEEYPDSPNVHKAQLHLATLLDDKPKGIPAWIFAIALYITFNAKTPNPSEQEITNLYYWFTAIIGLAILNWARLSWKTPAIDDMNSKIGSATGWLWAIAIVNTVLGTLLLKGVMDPPKLLEGVTPTDYIWFGLVFFVAGPIVSWNKHAIAPLALLVGIIVWGEDTASMISGIVFSAFKVNPFFYLILFFHFIALNSMMGGMRGLSARSKFMKNFIPMEPPVEVTTTGVLIDDVGFLNNEKKISLKGKFEKKSTEELLALLEQAEEKGWSGVIDRIRRELISRGEALPDNPQTHASSEEINLSSKLDTSDDDKRNQK